MLPKQAPAAAYVCVHRPGSRSCARASFSDSNAPSPSSPQRAHLAGSTMQMLASPVRNKTRQPQTSQSPTHACITQLSAAGDARDGCGVLQNSTYEAAGCASSALLGAHAQSHCVPRGIAVQGGGHCWPRLTSHTLALQICSSIGSTRRTTSSLDAMLRTSELSEL